MKGTALADGLSLSCKTVVRRASCDLQQRSRHLRGTRASPTALAVSREVANFASLPARARRAALVMVVLRTT